MALPRLRAALSHWPLPAVLAWTGAWALYRLLLQVGVSPVLGLAGGCALGLVASRMAHSPWRRWLMAGGFPLSTALSGLMSGGTVFPAWGWLVLLVFSLALYPLHAWRDAPVFPTPAGALMPLPRHAALPPGASILDAGCGAGDGLQALRQAYPQARLFGLERSWPLRWLSAVRCPWARVRQGDIWQADWSAYDMVYLFQRPESMTRAAIKAAEMAPGAWMVSLEFEASHLHPSAQYRTPDGKMVWLYRSPVVPR
jgi:SAM-dependent methyltransferase